MTLSCMFCSDGLIKSYASFKSHIINKHKIMKFQQLLVAFFLLDQPEITELFSMLQPRLVKFKSQNNKSEVNMPDVDIKNERNATKTDCTIDKNNVELISLDDDDENNKVKKETSVDINSINLVHKFREAKQCKLCYAKCSSDAYLKRHEENVHKAHQTELALTKITLNDLKFDCNLCPGVKFLTESILLLHAKIQHGKTLKLTKSSTISLKCYFCDEKFSYGQKRNEHCLKIHGKEDEKVDETSVKCMVCDQIVKTETLKNHKAKNHAIYSRKGKCILCYRTFSNINIHIKVVHKKEKAFFHKKITKGDLKFDCPKCNYKFVSKKILKTHLAQHDYKDLEILKTTCFDKDTSTFKCCLCFTKIKSSISHISRHALAYHKDEIDQMKDPPSKNVFQYQCPECKLKAFSENSVLVHRLLEHYAIDSDDLACKFCETSFKNQTGALSHRIKIHKDEIELFQATFSDEYKNQQCQFCDEKYFIKSSLNYHYKKSHKRQYENSPELTKRSRNKNTLCALCYVEVSNNYYFSHKKRYHANELHFFNKALSLNELAFNCSKCDQKFISLNSMKIHLDNHPILLTCFFCPEKFKGHTNLTEHCKSIHEKQDESIDVKNSKCMVCGKILKKTHLTVHRMTHNKDKLYECQLCYSKFTTETALRKHKRKVHKSAEEMQLLNVDSVTDPAHACDKCDYKFYTESLLKQHLTRKHSYNFKRKPDAYIFECNLCYQNFGRPNHLKEHRERVHFSSEERALFDVDEIKKSLLREDCLYCDKKFFNLMSAKHHTFYAHKSEMRQESIRNQGSETSCELCGKVFKWKNRKHFSRHMKIVHNIIDFDPTVESFKKQEKSDTVSNFNDFLNSLHLK